MRARYYERDQAALPPAPQLVEKEEKPKVVLYDDKGKPLTYPPKRVGFQPPRDRQS